ncbi:MAG: ABC transporter substrate-binding protein [Kineosporiaceae bacterium]
MRPVRPDPPGARRRALAVTAAAAAAAALVACGGETAADGDDDSSPAASDDPAGATAAGGSLAGACPSPLVIQTDWNPEAEHGALYEMIGDDPQVDAEAKIVTGPLVAGGEETGIDLEIRVGGPAIGFQSPSAQMYLDPDITMAYVSTDEAARVSADQPTVAVVAPLEINPQIIMWDPETYPDVEGIADLGEAGVRTLYFEGAAYMDYLVGEGILGADQIDGSYSGTPEVFVASGGEVAQQGFASAEPYVYENEVSQWARPVDFELIHDTGFPVYAAPLAVRAGDLQDLSPCLELVVPIVQQAQVDYVGDPAETNELILRLVEEYDTGWVYSAGVAEFSVAQQVDLGLVGNGPDGTLGDFDLDRVQEVIDIVTPIYAEQGTPVAEGLAPEDLVTNEFIDESIGLE